MATCMLYAGTMEEISLLFLFTPLGLPHEVAVGTWGEILLGKIHPSSVLQLSSPSSSGLVVKTEAELILNVYLLVQTCFGLQMFL